MHHLYHFYAVVLSACLCTALGPPAPWRFRVRMNVNIQNRNVDKTIATNTAAGCVALCQSEPDFLCETVSWSQGICLLSRAIRIQMATSQLESDSDWTTMFRVAYPVFVAIGPGSDQSLTFVEGKNKCIELRTRIATPQELLDARAMGFEFCRCAWLSDGTAGFVMQVSSENCWDQWSAGIIGGCTEMYKKLSVWCIA